MQQKFITKCVTYFITKWDGFITKWNSYYKMQRLLQNVSVHAELRIQERDFICQGFRIRYKLSSSEFYLESCLLSMMELFWKSEKALYVFTLTLGHFRQVVISFSQRLQVEKISKNFRFCHCKFFLFCLLTDNYWLEQSPSLKLPGQWNCKTFRINWVVVSVC